MSTETTPAPPQTPPAPALGRKGSFLPNLLSNFANFAITLVIGLWFTPYLIRNLGTAVYGLVPLATTVIYYMSVLTVTLNTSVGRFLTIALEKNDFVKANRVFNTSFFAGLGIAAVLLIPCILLSVFADKIVQVPPGHETEARHLFAYVAAAFLLNAVITPFGVSTFARNRFDLRNLVTIVQNVSRPAFVVVLFALIEPRLWHIGFGTLGAAVLFAIGSVINWKILTPVLRISFRNLHWDTFKSISNTSTWVIVGQLGFILLTGVELIVVNRMLGAESAGRYAAVLQWSMLIRSMGAIIVSLFAPTIISYYAKKNIDGLVDYARHAIKLIGLLMALPIGLVCGFSGPLLYTWLGKDFADLAPLMILMVAPLCFNLAGSPLAPIYLAADKVRTPALMNVLLGVLTLVAAILLAGPAGWGIYGVAAAPVIAITVRSLLFIPIYASSTIHRSSGPFIRQILTVGLVTAIVTLVAWFCASQLNPYGWLQLGFLAVTAAALYAPLTYFLFLNAVERELLAAKFPPPLRKYLPLVKK